MLGYNSRLTGCQAAVLSIKLRRLDAWNEARRRIASAYTDGLLETPLALPREAEYATSAWHLYVLRSKQRDALIEHLSAAGIAVGIHYPVPIPKLEAMQKLGLPETPIPEAEAMAREALTLPIYPEMTDEQVEYVVRSVKGFF